MMRRPATQLALAMGALLFGAACQPNYASVELETVSTPPANTTVRDEFIEIPAGVAVVIRADALSRNRKDYDSSYDLDLFSSDRSIFTTFRRPRKNEFLIVGLDPGSACLEVVIDGQQEDCIDVTVLPPAT